MKRFAYYIALLPLVALCGCSHDDIDEITAVGNGKIVIESKLDNMHITRANIADTNKERTVEYIDVFAVDANGNIAYYERNEAAANNNGAAEDGAGTLTLNVARRAKNADGDFYFAADAKYSFYLVANATATEDTMSRLATLNDLQLLVQDDSFDPGLTTKERQTLLHLSGTNQGENTDNIPTPQTFLMDAVAMSGTETSVVVNPATGSVSNLDLTAEFKRAAAKIIVNITQGDDVEFHKELRGQGSQYDFYKLPANTFVLPREESLVGIELINTAPMMPNDETFIWANEDGSAENKLQIIGYAYAHSWDNTTWANETSLILNIPMKWNQDNDANHTKETEAPKSWYKVPLSKDKKFERNKCYVVNITVNAVGAANRSTAIELRDIEYRTLDWESVGVDVGENDERPEFLVLNTDLVEMYNVNFDNSSLSFSSSSPITSVVLKDVYSQNSDGTFTVATDNYSAYYINKFGVKTNLNNTIRGTISATAEADVLNGGISIMSPIVPATAAEIEKQILEQLGTAPTAPTLATPSYSGTMPTEPTVVAEPTAPDPDDYVKSTSTQDTDDIDWETTESGGSIFTYPIAQEGTQTETSYQYITNADGSITFQLRTRTRTVTRTRDNFYDDWSYNYANWSESAWSADTATQTRWDNAMATYNADLATYNQYLEDKKAYDEAMAELNNDPAYQQYLTDKAAYDSAWAQYNTEKARYDEQAEAIRAVAGGEETHYNTIRYLEFEVTNEQGLKATFRVMQYPVIYVTNQQGWYSYRDDFGSSYENKGDRNVRIRLSMTNNNSWDGSYIYDTTAGWGNNNDSYSSRYFWQSKVVSSYNENTGKSTTSFYSWSQNSNSSTATIGNACETDANARMYHIRVTATSQTYTIGKPRLDSDGFTDSSNENAKLVSPSFMIASRLGAIYSSYGGLNSVGDGEDDDNDGVADRLEIFRDHCKNYVEVYKDAEGNAVVFDDWRLPTASEINIIIDLQGGADDDAPAIDYLLNGYYYMSANGPVYNPKGNNENTNTSAIRCIRDAY